MKRIVTSISFLFLGLCLLAQINSSPNSSISRIVTVKPIDSTKTLKAEDPAPVDPALLSKDTFLFDLVYNRETKILAGARARGIPCADGLAMLLHQGARSFEIWTGLEAPVEEMRRALFNR